MSQATDRAYQRSGAPPGASFDELPSVRTAFKDAAGAALAKAGLLILQGRNQRGPSQFTRRSRHSWGQQFGSPEPRGDYLFSQQQGNQSPWSQQQSGQPWTQQRNQAPWMQGADLDQVSYAAQLDGSTPWRIPVNQRTQFPRTMTGSSKGTILKGLADETIDALFTYCPGAAVALLDWFVMHRSEQVLPMARRRLTGLLQTVSAGPQAISSARMGELEAQESAEGQLTTAVAELGVRYMVLRDTPRIGELSALQEDAAALSRALASRQHVNRQVSACIIQAVTQLVTQDNRGSNETMARALTLLGAQFKNELFKEIAGYVNPAVAEQTRYDVGTYDSRTETRERQPAMAGGHRSGSGDDRDDHPGEGPGDSQL